MAKTGNPKLVKGFKLNPTGRNQYSKGLHKPTLKQKLFVQEYLNNGGVASKAIRTVYGDSHTARKRAAQLINRPHIKAMIAGAEKKLMDAAAPSIDKLEKLRDSSDSEKIQLDAARSLLDGFNESMRRYEKREQYSGQTTTNILIADLSDEQLSERIRTAIAVSGTDEETVQEGPGLPDDGDIGLQEPGEYTPGSGADLDQGGDRQEEGSVPAPTRPLEEYRNHDIVHDTTHTAGS